MLKKNSYGKVGRSGINNIIWLYLQKSVLFVLTTLIMLYRSLISPFLPKSCIFYPTCSSYALQTLRIHGVYGLALVVKRILSCHPFSRGGIDMVPKKNTKVDNE